MAKRRGKNPFPFLSSFNEKKFEPFIRAIGQSTLLWNDLHEWLAHLYCIAIGGGYINKHLRVWNSIANDRAKRDMLLAAAKYNFVEDKGRRQTPLDAKSFEAIKYLYDECQKLEEDRNNAIHAPLWKSLSDGEVYPSSAFGNQRAKKLENKSLLKEYQSCETQHTYSATTLCCFMRLCATGASHGLINRNCQIAGAPKRRHRPSQIAKQSLLAGLDHSRGYFNYGVSRFVRGFDRTTSHHGLFVSLLNCRRHSHSQIVSAEPGALAMPPMPSPLIAAGWILLRRCQPAADRTGEA